MSIQPLVDKIDEVLGTFHSWSVGRNGSGIYRGKWYATHDGRNYTIHDTIEDALWSLIRPLKIPYRPVPSEFSDWEWHQKVWDQEWKPLTELGDNGTDYVFG